MAGLQLELSTDADWNDNACTSRSVSGMRLEPVNPKSGNVFPLAWSSSRQSATSCSMAESKVVALSHGLRHFGLPVQDLVHEFLGERIPLVCLVDNQQTTSATKRGYSKRLRCLNRTHRVAIGSLHEIVGDERQRVEIRYIESKLQKGNIYTKAWYLRNSALSGFLLESKDPATTATLEVDDLTVLRTPREEWKNREISSSLRAALLEQSDVVMSTDTVQVLMLVGSCTAIHVYCN